MPTTNRMCATILGARLTTRLEPYMPMKLNEIGHAGCSDEQTLRLSDEAQIPAEYFWSTRKSYKL
jgi:hypothetical protein